VRRPITDADLRAILVAPTPSKAKKGKKAKAPGAAVSHSAVKLSDPGTYAVSFTPAQKGVHHLVVRGSAKGVGEFEHGFALPVDVWPLPEDLQLPVPPTVSNEPELSWGDI